MCATYIDRGRAKLEENEEVKVARPLFWPRVSRRRGFLALLGALSAVNGGLGVRPTHRRRIGLLSWAQESRRMLCAVGSTKAPLREAAVVGDHRSDGRFLEASASFEGRRRTPEPTLTAERSWLSVCHLEAELRGAWCEVWVKIVDGRHKVMFRDQRVSERNQCCVPRSAGQREQGTARE